MTGMSTADWSTYLVQSVGLPGTAGQVADEVSERMGAHDAEAPTLLPGAVEAVRGLAGRRPLGLASS